MRKTLKTGKGDYGQSLFETIVMVFLAGFVAIVVAQFLNYSRWGFTSLEARNSLKSAGQIAVNGIKRNLVTTKRLFQNTPNDNGFLPTVSQPPIADSRLPIIYPSGSFSPTSSSFTAAGVGNSLFFASVDQTQEFSYDGSGSTATLVRIDLYHFNYYYLSTTTADASVIIGDRSKRSLWAWRSIPYADYNQLNAQAQYDMSRATMVINGLALSSPTVSYAWDPSTNTISGAFYQLDTTTPFTLQPGYQIQQSSPPINLINIITGVTGGGYRYSVSPNSSAVSGFAPSRAVPQFAVPSVSGEFPSGFEVMAIGPSSSRQVFVRLVLVALGAMSGMVTDEETVQATIVDLW